MHPVLICFNIFVLLTIFWLSILNLEKPCNCPNNIRDVIDMKSKIILINKRMDDHIYIKDNHLSEFYIPVDCFIDKNLCDLLYSQLHVDKEYEMVYYVDNNLKRYVVYFKSPSKELYNFEEGMSII